MAELRQRIRSLSPEKLNLLELRLKQRAREVQAVEVIPRAGDTPRRLTFGQERVWFIDQLAPASAANHLAWALRLRGTLHVGALQKALDTIVARQEALRTVFREVEGTLYQFVEAARPVEMRLLNLTDDPSDERIRSVCFEEARRRFDLAHDLLIRSALLQLQSKDHILLLTLHHIGADGWSRGILLRELSLLYAAFVDGHAPSLPDLPLSYADFAEWQRHSIESGPLEAQLAYWKQQLAGTYAALNIPSDFPRPASQSYRGAREIFVLSDDLAKSVKALSRQENATLFMTLLATFQILLHRYTGEPDIAVGTPVANRNRVETEGLIGFFVNMVVMRADLSGEPTFRQVLRRVRELTLGAYAHQDVPFEKVIDRLRIPRHRSHSPIFQVMLVLLNAPAAAFEPPGLSAEIVEVETGATQSDLVMEIVERPNQMVLRLAYRTDLFEPATARRMLRHYEILLQAAVRDPELAISRLPLLT